MTNGKPVTERFDTLPGDGGERDARMIASMSKCHDPVALVLTPDTEREAMIEALIGTMGLSGITITREEAEQAIDEAFGLKMTDWNDARVDAHFERLVAAAPYPRLVLRDIKNKEKFQQAVLYFLHQMGPMTEEHLTYLLYQLDFDHLEHHRRSITGGNYYKELTRSHQ